MTNEFTKTDYINWSYKVFEGFYESGLYNSDTLYYLTENDRGEITLDDNDNEFPVLKDDECYDFTENGWTEFEKDVCTFAVDKLEELATEFRNEEQMILKNFSLRGVQSPNYYNFETDKLHIDLEVNVRALELFCFTDHRAEFNKYLQSTFTSCDGFISFIDNNVIDFRETYLGHGNESERIDSREGNVMIEFFLLTCIYNDTDLSEIDSVSIYDYEYHSDLVDHANEVIWQYIEPTKI